MSEYLGREKEPDTGALNCNSKQRKKEQAPSHCFKDYIHPNEDQHRTAEEFFWSFQKNTTYITVISAVAALIFAILAFNQTRIQADAATTLNRRSYTAKFKVRNVIVYDFVRSNEAAAFKPGDRLTVEANIINFGFETATQQDSACIVYWHKGPLPMLAPFTGQDATCKGEWHLGVGDPASVYQVNVQTIVPVDYTPETKLYFMGYMRYRDPASPNLSVVFAKVFDPERGRFVPVKDNPDYENEEGK